MEYVRVPKDEYERLKSNIVELDATKIGKAIITLYNDYEKLNKQKQELIEWLEKKRDYCIQEKDKKYIDDLGKEQLLGCYLTCIELLERLVGEE